MRIGMIAMVVFLTAAGLMAAAQSPERKKAEVHPGDSASMNTEKKFSISGMLLTRFAQSFNQDVDVNGNFHREGDKYSRSSFSIRRVRVQGKATITPGTEVALLLNLTDFIGNPSGKVLENAYVRHRFNSYLNVQFGQFRPYFGKEDLFPEEQLHVLEWSNQYYLFGSNGWQSFQDGITVFGEASVFSMPVKYYLGVFNGNGRNQLMDTDNGKIFPARIEVALHPSTRVGMNGGVGKHSGEKIWAFNADMDHVQTLGARWQLEIQSEYKRGINQSVFDTSSDCNKRISHFQAEGFYLLPNLVYQLKNSAVHSIAFSFRYEKLNADINKSNARRETLMPVIGVQFADAYQLRILTGMIIDHYHQPATMDKSATRLICQVQARF